MKLAVVALLLAAAAHEARADVHGWDVAVTAGTNAPLDLELGVAAESPQRIRIASTIGIMPRGYVDGIDSFLVGVGAVNQATGDLIADSLSTSAVWRTMVGYRPWRCRGFYAMAGYALVAFGGSATGAEALQAATGKPAPPDDANKRVDIDSHLHTLDVEIGWRWNLQANFVLQVAVGGVFTVGAATTITPDYTPREATCSPRPPSSRSVAACNSARLNLTSIFNFGFYRAHEQPVRRSVRHRRQPRRGGRSRLRR